MVAGLTTSLRSFTSKADGRQGAPDVLRYLERYA
jgi:hypothetical protein